MYRKGDQNDTVLHPPPNPVRRDEVLLQQVGSDRTQLVVKQLDQGWLLLLDEVLGAPERYLSTDLLRLA